jgi:Tol biopolymer transport system component/DNA-binding winged helix-turn-helix (wHTH) protein
MMSGDFRIAEWEVQPAVNRVRRGDQIVRLEPKVMQVLVCLAEHAGDVVTRETLIARVWPDVFVTDDVLHRAIRELRRVFGDDTAAPRYIETIRKRGYRLIATVSTGLDRISEASPAELGIVAPMAGAIAIATPVASVRPWPFTLAAAALVVACAAVLFALLSRPASIATQAHARFVPLVSGPLNESDPAIAPDGQRVAYVLRDGPETAHADIYIQPQGGAAIRFTDHPADDRMPAWSPDGRRLAFVRLTAESCDIYVRAIESASERRVAACGNVHEPRVTWTGEGDALLLSDAPSRAMHGWRIGRLSLATGERTALTSAPSGAVGDHSPSVSPDGRRIAFIRQVSGGVADVFVVPSEGGAPRRVTFDEADLTGVDWINNGRALVYSSDRAGGYSLWRVPAEGGEPELVAGGAARLKHPVAARGAERVAYESWNYEINIWQVALGKTGRSSLAPQTPPPAPGRGTEPGDTTPVIRTSDLWNLYPQLSPDGRRLAFVSTQSGSHEIWIAARDGSGARQLTRFGDEPRALSRGSTVRLPRWSPDGSRLVFAAHRSGAVDVFVAEIESGAITAITSDASVEVAPSWSADGQRIYYGARQGDVWRVYVRDAVAQADATLAISDAFAAQSSPDGAWLYFSRADRAGLWRVPVSATAGSATAGTAPTLVVAALSAGAWANWTVTPHGLYYVGVSGHDIVLRHTPLAGGDIRTVINLPNYSWPGLTITADGAHVLYARWDRRESNIMSIEF